MKKLTFLFFVIVSVAGMIAMGGCNKDKKASFMVSFNSNGGTGSMSAQKFTEGEPSILATCLFTREGYNFKDWNTIADGSGATFTDGQRITVSSDMTLYAQWTKKETPNPLNGHEWVDLGLPSGIKWATCNVGATTSDGAGEYYAWGETSTKGTFDWSTYRYSNGGYNKLTKYCSKSDYGNNGFTDELTTLVAGDDVATAKWGAGWRMPTREDFQELIDNCTTTWSNNGRLFTGPNGNSIFIPAAGFYNSVPGYVNYYLQKGRYWTSTLDTDYPCWVYDFWFDSSECNLNSGGDRTHGVPVRAVCE